MESKLAASERRIEASEARTQKFEAELIELRSQARDSAAKTTDDLRRCEADVVKVDKAVTGLRIATGERLTRLRERVADVVEKRPAFDHGYVDRAVDAIVARALAEARTEHAHELEAQRREFSAQIAGLEERVRAVPGRLPVAKAYEPGAVVYRGELVVDGGSCWQALRDTGRAPGEGDDWACVAKGGRDGVNGRDGGSLRLRGGYNVHGKYARFDVVEFGSDAFVARRDSPGACPGDGWLKLTGPRGEKGEKGELGPRGSRGEQGVPDKTLTIDGWTIDAPRYRAIPKLSNSTVGAALELRPLFQLYQAQTSE
jgi:hypothetical protein